MICGVQVSKARLSLAFGVAGCESRPGVIRTEQNSPSNPSLRLFLSLPLSRTLGKGSWKRLIGFQVYPDLIFQ